jgi:hypothetical protein
MFETWCLVASLCTELGSTRPSTDLICGPGDHVVPGGPRPLNQMSIKGPASKASRACPLKYYINNIIVTVIVHRLRRPIAQLDRSGTRLVQLPFGRWLRILIDAAIIPSLRWEVEPLAASRTVCPLRTKKEKEGTLIARAHLEVPWPDTGAICHREPMSSLEHLSYNECPAKDHDSWS